MKRKLLVFTGVLTVLMLGGKFLAAPVVAQAVNAVLVKNLDEKGRAPYMEYQVRVCPGGIVCEVAFPPVPSGKRLVLEHVNAAVTFATGGVRFTSLAGPQNRQFVFPAHATADATIQIINETTLMFFESGEIPVFRAGLGSSKDVSPINVALSGYLVDLAR